MNRTKWLTAACFLLLGHMSLAQQNGYGNRRHGDDDDNRSGQQYGAGYNNQYPNSNQGSYGNQYPGNNQGSYSNPYGNNRGGYGQNCPRNYGPNGRYDRRSDMFRLDRLDRIVDLNGFQKRDLFRLEQYYDRQFSLTQPAPGAYQRLMWQKSQDVLSILNPIQRDRLFAFEQYRAYGGNAYGSNGDGDKYGRGNGRRW